MAASADPPNTILMRQQPIAQAAVLGVGEDHRA